MKRFAFALGLLAWSPLYAQDAKSSLDYRLISVPHADIDQHLVIGSTATATPPNLQGLWWMDGNPLADKVVSFAGAKITPIIVLNQVVSYEIELPVYDEGVWSWDDTADGHELYDNVLKTRLTYFGRFNTDFSYGDVTPVIQPLPYLPPVPLPQSILLDFTMTKVAPDEFRRDSIILGQSYAYRFRRIVDGEGKRLPAYEEYLTSLQRRGLVNAWLPVCDANSAGVRPTVCAGFPELGFTAAP